MAERDSPLLKRAAENIIQARHAEVARELLLDRTRPLFSEAYLLLDLVLPKKEPSHREQFRQFSFRIKKEGTITPVKVTVSRDKDSIVQDKFRIEVDGLGEFLVLRIGGASVRIPSFDHDTWKTSYEDTDPSLEKAEQYLDLVRRIAKRCKVKV